MLKVLSNILCDLDPKVKVIGQKAGICDGVSSTSALVTFISMINTTSERLKARNLLTFRYFRFYEQLKFRAQLRMKNV